MVIPIHTPLTGVDAKQRATGSPQGRTWPWLTANSGALLLGTKDNVQTEDTDLYTAIPLSLFTTVTNWEQPKCPSVEDRVSKAETIHSFSGICRH